MGKLIARLFRGPLQTTTGPPLERLFVSSEICTTIADDVLAAEMDAATISSYRDEYRTTIRALNNRYHDVALSRARNCATEHETGFLLYALVRHGRPQRVVETGVANGHSTYLILRALDENGTGTLHSIEVDEDVGQLVPARLRSIWRLHVLDDWRDLRAVAGRIAPFDLFFHDGDHRYPGQFLDYEVAHAGLRRGGWMVSDDIDASWAFLHFCGSIGSMPSVLVEPRKVAGLVRP